MFSIFFLIDHIFKTNFVVFQRTLYFY